MDSAGLFQAAARCVAGGPLGAQAVNASPWEVLPAAEAALRAASTPEAIKPELHAACAHACARFGLRTLAELHLQHAAGERAGALAPCIASLPDDRFDLDERLSICKFNLAAIRADAATLEALHQYLPKWERLLRDSHAFRTPSGVLVRSGDVLRGEWRLFIDDQALAGSVSAASLGSGPIYVDGVHAPRTLIQLMHATERPLSEPQVGVVLLASCADELLDGLALADLREVLAKPRLRVMIGADIPARLAREFEDRLCFVLGQCVTIPRPPTRPEWGTRWARAAISDALAAAGRQQGARATASRAVVRDMYAPRDAAWWRARYEHARDVGPPLRVLVMTARHSTVVRHVARDLADECERAGMRARVLIEPDDTSRFTSLAITLEIESFDPDLIFLINNVRSQLGGALPERVPVVTWIQDAMTHLFDLATGSALGEFDFVVGHLHPELFEHFGFKRERCIYSPVLASEAKFHAGPIDPDLRRRFECEIAYASHQSETPEAFVARLRDRSQGDATIARVLPNLFPLVVLAAQRSGLDAPPLLESLRSICVEALREMVGEVPSAQTLAVMYHTLAAPIAERVLRQQMVGWAAETCEKRGWRLHLYGEGWERNPRFARYARGALPHGEALRAAYQSARLHLHAGLGGVHHQRVLECALSGGCTLVRVKKDDIHFLEWWAQNDLAMTADAAAFTPAFPELGELYVAPVADYWQSMMVHALYDRLGVPQQHPLRGRQVVAGDQLRHPWGARFGTPLPFRAAWLVGDLAESGFWSADSFERAAASVIERPPRRDSLVAWQRGAACDHFSLSSLAQSMREMIERSLRTSRVSTSSSGRSAPLVSACR